MKLGSCHKQRLGFSRSCIENKILALSSDCIDVKTKLNVDFFEKINSDKKLNNSILKELFPDGVDKLSFRQVSGDNDLNDCYFLSTIKAMSLNKKGSEKLSECIKKSKNGYTIFFKDKAIELSFDEVKNGVGGCNVDTNSTGLKILETAYAKLKCPEDTTNQAISGSKHSLRADDVFENLFGCEAFEIASNLSSDVKISNKNFRKEAIDFLEEVSMRPDDFMIVIGTSKVPSSSQSVKLIPKHAYCLAGVDSKNRLVKIIDPYNSDEIKMLNYNEFLERFNSITGVDLTGKYNKKAKEIFNKYENTPYIPGGIINLSK